MPENMTILFVLNFYSCPRIRELKEFQNFNQKRYRLNFMSFKNLGAWYHFIDEKCYIFPPSKFDYSGEKI